MDYLVRAAAASLQIRCTAITSKDLAEEARKAHQTGRIATAALGRTLSGALMMADTMLKNEKDLLTLQISGDGPIGGITVTADHNGTAKGYVQNPEVDLPPNAQGHLNVGGAVGRGTLTLIRDMGLKDPYVGQVALSSGEIADDLTYYFAVSEQVPSSVGLGVLLNPDDTVREAGGFIIQLMPFAEEETIAKLEENLGKIPPVTDMLREGMRPEDILEKVLDGFDITWNGTKAVKFSCNCSRDRVERAIILLGKEEIAGMIEEDHEFELGCQFCGKKYVFTTEDLKQLRLRALAENLKRRNITVTGDRAGEQDDQE